MDNSFMDKINKNQNGETMKITFLGTGANGGVPQLDCRCENCKAAGKNSAFVRRRSSLLVEFGGKMILIECGPDLWGQLRLVDMKLQDLDLIVVSHLHFDHANGLMELSGGKRWKVPVLMSLENREKAMKGEMAFLVERGFMNLVDEEFASDLGVTLVDIPHDPNFPTSGILVTSGSKKVWFSTDVEDITVEMTKVIKKTDLVVFDATFFDESVFPALKIHHMTIEKSLPILTKLGARVIYSHINHSEDVSKVETALKKFGFSLASDGLVISV